MAAAKKKVEEKEVEKAVVSGGTSVKKFRCDFKSYNDYNNYTGLKG